MNKEFLAKKEDLLNGIAINQTTIGTQCKNLLNHTLETTEINGVTITVNRDKSITINGEATSNIKILLGKIKDNKKNNLILSGCPDGGSRSSYNLELAWTNISYNDLLGEYIAVSQEGYDIGKNYTYIRKKNDSKSFDISLIINKGTVMSNHIFKPMVRYADITDETYEPYKENVDERIIKNTSDIDVNKSDIAVNKSDIAVNKSDIAINKTTLGYQSKNLLKPTSSKTRAGITYTVHEDGSVTLTGVSTTGSTYNYFSIPVILKPGKYKVNGMPSTSSNSTYRVDLRSTESGGTVYGYGAKEFEVEFAETTTAYYMIRIDGTYKEELGGVTFYPMIRYADITDDTYEPYKENIDERLIKIQNEIGDIESVLSSIVEVS